MKLERALLVGCSVLMLLGFVAWIIDNIGMARLLWLTAFVIASLPLLFVVATLATAKIAKWFNVRHHRD